MMALSDAVKAAISRLRTFYEGSKPYNAATNPGGLQNDGHRVNFVPALQDVGAVVAAAGDLVDQAAAYAANSPKALRVDLGQSFADPEIAQALVNIGLLADTLPLNADQKSKILANLGAAAVLAAAVQKGVSDRQDMAGPLAINTFLDIVRGNVLRARFVVDGNANVIIQNGDNGDNFLYVGANGAVWTKQVGDLATYINNVGTNNQNAAVNRSAISARQVYVGDYDITNGINAGPIEPYAASCCTGRAAIVSGDGNDVILRSMRFRQQQIFIPNQGWVAAYYT